MTDPQNDLLAEIEAMAKDLRDLANLPQSQHPESSSIGEYFPEIAKAADLLTALQARVRALEEELKAVDEACLAVCPCNTEQTCVEEVDPELGRYVCMDEDGEPIIDTGSPAEVIARLDELWGKQQERAETAEYGLAALRKEPTNG